MHFLRWISGYRSAMNQLNELRDALRVEPGERVRLDDADADSKLGWERDDAEEATARELERLAGLQDRLWAEQKRGVLVVLQGIDTSGKDGTIRKVAGAFNPQGCVVSSFKVPTSEELAHDFLWRIHRRAPGKGIIGIFNRSHYEDVLVVRVHSLVAEDVWRARYEQIRQFERLLHETGTTIVKLMLHISRDEQRERLQARYDDPEKHWKFSLGDLDERKRWDDYMAAFEDALRETSTPDAPWYIIPADRKWFRNLAVARILADTIEELKPDYPPAPELPADLVIE
ncbi:polyphosphate kinase 2 family protein [soil metagenome]